MQTYRIVKADDGSFTAEYVRKEGWIVRAFGFVTRRAALEWVGERLMVMADRREPDEFDS